MPDSNHDTNEEEVSGPIRDTQGNLNWTDADFVMVVNNRGDAKEYDLEDNGVDKAIAKAREWVSSYYSVKIIFTKRADPKEFKISAEEVDNDE